MAHDYAHPRRVIREGIAERIGTVTENGDYWTHAEGRVYSTRSSAQIYPEEMPLIIVSATSEDSLPIDKSEFEGGYLRTLRVDIEGVAEALDDVEDVLDGLALGIEGAMDGLRVTDAESSHLLMTGTEIDIDRDGEIPIGSIRVTYEIKYHSYKLGVDLGFWDRNYPDNCPAPAINSITLRSHIPEDSVDYTEETINP
tara:strand:- start:9603 stop:10196 length:594 start_codon:yes stop_codon:yes gene_type:complete